MVETNILTKARISQMLTTWNNFKIYNRNVMLSYNIVINDTIYMSHCNVSAMLLITITIAQTLQYRVSSFLMANQHNIGYVVSYK